jgi:8-oxo-dGTP diphosphatase
MEHRYNPHISVDCTVFGFDNEILKVLLVKRDPKDQNEKVYKLPGDLIIKKEGLQHAAQRILTQYTGLSRIYLKQFAVFDDPERLKPEGDLFWLQQNSGMEISRVITIAYYSLVKIDQSKPTELSIEYGAEWFPVKQIPMLVFDHNRIIDKAVQTIKKEFLTDPLCFELLPKKFPLNQLQRLCEVVLGLKLDNRNFRKKVQKLGYIVPLEEKQQGVKHKPARLYQFKQEVFEDIEVKNTGMVI